MPQCVISVETDAPMPRLIKRYGSRKLYDPVESRYVSLQEITSWILTGEEVKIVDNESGEDATVQVLTQVISEQGRRGQSFPTGLLHDLIRAGEEALQAGEQAVSVRVRRFHEAAGHVADAVHKQVDRLKQPAPVEHELFDLKQRLEALEARLERIQRDA